MILRSALAVEHRRQLFAAPLVLLVLCLAAYLGRNPSVYYVLAPLALIALFAILRQPRLGLLALIILALVLPLRINTGTEVALYPVVLLLPALVALWVVSSLLQRRIVWPPSSIHLPLALFLAAGLLSLGIGNLIWDPLVPRKDSFILVQFAQWAIFAFSACALWLSASLVDQESWLRRMVAVFLVLGGCMALLRVCLSSYPFFGQISSGAVDRAPFWLLLVSVAGGQLLFNRKLHFLLQVLLFALIGLAVYFAFFLERQAAAYWVGVAAATGVLVWLRFPRLRIPIGVAIVVLITSGVVSSSIWDFAGGDAEWTESGASRLALIQRVVDVTMRNPITGLGPAAYRPYANMQPMLYGRALWLAPQINSHNNYVDIFAHTGLLGLVLFFWFMADMARLAWRLHYRHRQGLAAGYINGMMAALIGVMVLMSLLDWFLPFVYNVGFYGFQASVLVWLFMGGLVAIDQWPQPSAVPFQSRL